MINHNTQLLSATETTISFANRGLNYGDAVFETLRISAGKVLFWEDHYFRFMASMRILRMEIPMTFTPEFLEAEILKTVQSVGESNKTYRAKLLVWRNEGGKYTPTAKDVSFVITAEALETPFYTIAEAAYEVELFKDHYVTAGLLATLKTNNRLINVLGSIYAKENEYANCFLLNEKKQVVEALNGNIFLVNGYKIKTPPITDGCLNGILRKQIINILGHLPDYILEETSVSPFELQKADEIFITNTIVGIQPVSKYRKKEYGNTVAKELLQKLNVKARLG